MEIHVKNWAHWRRQRRNSAKRTTVSTKELQGTYQSEFLYLSVTDLVNHLKCLHDIKEEKCRLIKVLNLGKHAILDEKNTDIVPITQTGNDSESVLANEEIDLNGWKIENEEYRFRYSPFVSSLRSGTFGYRHFRKVFQRHSILSSLVQTTAPETWILKDLRVQLSLAADSSIVHHGLCLGDDEEVKGKAKACKDQTEFHCSNPSVSGSLNLIDSNMFLEDSKYSIRAGNMPLHPSDDCVSYGGIVQIDPAFRFSLCREGPLGNGIFGLPLSELSSLPTNHHQSWDLVPFATTEQTLKASVVGNVSFGDLINDFKTELSFMYDQFCKRSKVFQRKHSMRNEPRRNAGTVAIRECFLSEMKRVITLDGNDIVSIVYSKEGWKELEIRIEGDDIVISVNENTKQELIRFVFSQQNRNKIGEGYSKMDTADSIKDGNMILGNDTPSKAENALAKNDSDVLVDDNNSICRQKSEVKNQIEIVNEKKVSPSCVDISSLSWLKKFVEKNSIPMMDHLPASQKNLITKLWPKYKDLKTSLGYCLESGIDRADCKGYPTLPKSGIPAGDEEAFEVFEEIFNEAIQATHADVGKCSYQHRMPEMTEDLSPLLFESYDTTYVKSVKTTFFRSIKGFRFSPFLQLEERALIHELVKGCTQSLNGQFISLTTTDKDEKMLLLKKRFLCNTLGLVGYRQWPSGRAIILQEDDVTQKLVKVNFAEHLQISAARRDGNLTESIRDALNMENTIHEYLQSFKLAYCCHRRFGYLNSQIPNLGLAMVLGVRVVLPHLSKLPLFADLLDRYRLRHIKRATGNNKSERVIELQNIDKFTTNEIEIFKRFHEAITSLINIEKCLEEKADVALLLPEDLKEKVSLPECSLVLDIDDDVHVCQEEEEGEDKEDKEDKEMNDKDHSILEDPSHEKDANKEQDESDNNNEIEKPRKRTRRGRGRRGRVPCRGATANEERGSSSSLQNESAVLPESPSAEFSDDESNVTKQPSVPSDIGACCLNYEGIVDPCQQVETQVAVILEDSNTHPPSSILKRNVNDRKIKIRSCSRSKREVSFAPDCIDNEGKTDRQKYLKSKRNKASPGQ